MAGLLVDAKRRCDRAREQGRTRLPGDTAQQIRGRYNALLVEFFATHSPPRDGWRKGSYDRDAANLATALQDHAHEVLRFTTDLAVPFNNQPG